MSSFRINLTVPHDAYRSLQAYSKLHGVKPATLIRGFLIEMKPAFDSTVSAVEEAEKDKQQAMENLQLYAFREFADFASKAVKMADALKDLEKAKQQGSANDHD